MIPHLSGIIQIFTAMTDITFGLMSSTVNHVIICGSTSFSWISNIPSHVYLYFLYLLTREKQIKAMTSYHLTTFGMNIIKKMNNCWQGCGEMKTFAHCLWESNTHSHYGNQNESSSEN